jgi:hypothetical protein
MPDLDTSVPHSARVYDYLLGGKDNYEADRLASEQLVAVYPDLVRTLRANRAFLARAVRYLVTDTGVRQFLDIGTGIPAADNTHEVAQAAAPDSRIVYVDNDPVVLAHARALLTSTPEGACDYLDADLRSPAPILAAAARTLPDDLAPRERYRRRGVRRGDPPVQRGRARSADDAARSRRRGQPLLRTRAGAARPGPGDRVASGSGVRRGRRRGPVGGSRP